MIRGYNPDTQEIRCFNSVADLVPPWILDFTVYPGAQPCESGTIPTFKSLTELIDWIPWLILILWLGLVIGLSRRAKD